MKEALKTFKEWIITEPFPNLFYVLVGLILVGYIIRKLFFND